MLKKKIFTALPLAFLGLATLSGGMLLRPKTVADQSSVTKTPAQEEVIEYSVPAQPIIEPVVLPNLESEAISAEDLKKFEIDSDSDGLPDFLEAFYGTDPANPDTDNDGFKDGDEVKGGYNPKGEGKL